MLSVVNNVSSLNAQHQLGRSTSLLNLSLERLSSGLKINRGADGPAALVISETQRAQIAGLGQAIENTEKAVSMVQTAEGALNEINSLLVKIRSLAIDSANSGVNDDNALAANQAEISNALDTIDRIANNTQFGSKKLLEGSAGLNAVASNSNLDDLIATSDTTVGQFTIANIDANAQKGQVDVARNANAATRLSNSNNLAANEILTFNGNVTVNLEAGMTNTQVRDAVNAVTGQTGVEASIEATNGNLLLTHKDFGKNFTVISNVADAANQTGIGDELVDTSNQGADTLNLVELEGQNIQVDLTGPGAALDDLQGVGNVVTATTGDYNGLSFTVAADATGATTADVAGAIITVSDGTLTFQIGANAGQTASFSIAKASTDALGKKRRQQPVRQLEER